MSEAAPGTREADVAALDEQARAILRANDRGTHTVPTAGLYPHQWNWDSVFAALGLATFDVERAWREIESLLDAQWPSGLVPHIVFRNEDDDYFPGPGVWGGVHRPPSSGITQPPVAATVVRELHRLDPAAGEARLRAALPKLLAWHRWFRAARDPRGNGLIAVTHPWESGRDNSPDWDAAMDRVPVVDLPPYTRRDTGHVAAEKRPTRAEYDRYLSLVAFGRECGWDDATILSGNPLLVIDPAMTFVLIRADRDLAAVARLLGEAAVADELDEAAARASRSVESLWSDRAGAYLARDARTGEAARDVTIGAFVAFHAGLGSDALRATLETQIARSRFALASADPAGAGFDAVRYWRGPVWPQMNYLVGRGLEDAGHAALAERLRGDLAALVARTGFHECYSSLDGSGAGGRDFTWTAALWLHWASPSARKER